MFPNNSNGGAGLGKSGTTASSAGAGRNSSGSTPPSSNVNQPPVQQQQQPQQFTYPPPHPTYTVPFPFQLVGPPSHHGHHGHPQGTTGGGGNVGAGGGTGQGGAPSLIDPMLSTLSDGGEGMSEDEEGTEGNQTAGVKQGSASNVGGNNGGPGSLSLAVSAVVDENGQPIKKKRRRQALSCTECKRRKIKCDRQNPCNPCTSEKFVTRGEYDLLHQKVIQLETLVASVVPRALFGGLDPLNLPMGPPPFGFVPPGHPGAPQHPYPGHPGQGQSGVEGTHDGQYHPGEAPPGHPPYPPGLQDLQRAYQAYAASGGAAAAVHPPPHAPGSKSNDSNMDVDQQRTGQLTPVAIKESDQKPADTTTTGSKPPRNRKRKDRVEEDGNDDPGVSTSMTGKGKGRRSHKAGASQDLAAATEADSHQSESMA